MPVDVVWRGRLRDSSAPPPPAPSGAFIELNATTPTALSYNGQDLYLRGTNFNNLPALGLWQTPDITKIKTNLAYYELLASMGANHTRFGLSQPWWEQSRNQFFDVLDQHIAWAKQNSLWVLLNNFVLPDNIYEAYGGSPYAAGGIFWTDAGLQERFTNYCVDLADHFANEPVVCGYDLLNEPGAPDNTTWFNYAQYLRDQMYTVDQNHLVIIETRSGGQFWHIFNGDNIVYSHHMYSPQGLTHSSSGTSAVYPGWYTEWDNNSHYFSKDTMNAKTDTATGNPWDNLTDLQNRYCIKWGRDVGVPVLVGEWGAREYVPGRIDYIRDVGELFTQWNLHSSHFQFVASASYNFCLFNENTLAPYYPSLVTVMEDLWAGSLRPSFA
ncbi:MAG TPA: cellulase family glycosylhydrolase [Bellilinea sp.]|nr:cellulase family glycosylhydrolase [Bellilinea sp.]